MFLHEFGEDFVLALQLLFQQSDPPVLVVAGAAGAVLECGSRGPQEILVPTVEHRGGNAVLVAQIRHRGVFEEMEPKYGDLLRDAEAIPSFLGHGKTSARHCSLFERLVLPIPTEAKQFLGRRYWRRCDLLGQLRAQLLEMEARQGTFVFDIDQTYCSQQGKLTENTIIRGEKTKRPKKSEKKSRERSSLCFVRGLLIPPSGIRLPFSVSYYTEAYCKAKKIAHRKQTELAAQLIRQLPLPPEARGGARGAPALHA